MKTGNLIINSMYNMSLWKSFSIKLLALLLNSFHLMFVETCVYFNKSRRYVLIPKFGLIANTPSANVNMYYFSIALFMQFFKCIYMI